MEDKLLTLLNKLCSEQIIYTTQLARQRPEEILKHAYEYIVRENILECIADLELTEAQLTALIAFPSPMEAIYGEYNRRDEPQIEAIRDSIRSCANNALLCDGNGPLAKA